MALPDSTAVEITELLLKSGADPNIRDCAFGTDDSGRTPCHIACSREDNDKVNNGYAKDYLQAAAFCLLQLRNKAVWGKRHEHCKIVLSYPETCSLQNH